MPDPLGLLKAAGELAGPSSAVVVSLRPPNAGPQILPDDCYQQWTEEEFGRFADGARNSRDLVRAFVNSHGP